MTTHSDMRQTTKLPAISNADLVLGPRRLRLPYRLIVVAALLAATMGCATVRTPAAAPEVESVGHLTASYNSIATAPVHASTDLTPSFGAVDTDEAAPATVTAPTETVEAPATVEKIAHGF